MIKADDFQAGFTRPQQKKTFLFLAITFVLLLFRIIVLVFEKYDIQSIQVSRSFVGNGFLSKPLLSELLLSLLIIVLLWGKERIKKPLLTDLRSGVINTLWFLAFPVIIALCLFTFKSAYYLKLEFNEMLVLRWLYFVLTFAAVNKIIDINPFHKFLRAFLIILILLSTSVLQDFTSNSNALSVSYAAFSGAGLTQALSIIAFRNTLKNSYWAGLFSAILTGSVVCFTIFGAVSGSYLTMILPFTGLLLAAISMHSKSLKTRIISICSVSLFSLLLSLMLPSLFPPQSRNLLRENLSGETKYHELVNGIQINYNDTSVSRPLRQVARLLQAANQVSQENFGISPDLRWITIYGIGQGGFNAVYPHGVEGNFPSQQYIHDILDSTFLNNPGLSHQFPDPVNALLHEYSHLYGIFPFQKWVSTESEGWATYSATRLSKLIYQKYGSSLWHPAYNYSRSADSNSVSLLSGHPLVWSHPQEIGAFRMYQKYEQKVGLPNLYKCRWQYTSRDKDAINIAKNNSSVINDFIVATIGAESFSQVSDIPSGKFEDLYNDSDWKIMAHYNNQSDDAMNRFIGLMKLQEININVPGPVKNPPAIEYILMISLVLLFISGKFILRTDVD